MPCGRNNDVFREEIERLPEENEFFRREVAREPGIEG